MLVVRSLPDAVLLDVTLRRDGQTKWWNISSWTDGWRCQYIDEHRFSRQLSDERRRPREAHMGS
jgi:hypothetical protein